VYDYGYTRFSVSEDEFLFQSEFLLLLVEN